MDLCESAFGCKISMEFEGEVDDELNSKQLERD
jgi:hypothetical protein